jgi:excisionase family DNA binding protein
MPLSLNGQKFYRTSEACAIAGISRMTFLRWVREGTITDVPQRDWRGWRLFTDDDVVRLKLKVNYINMAGNTMESYRRHSIKV